MPQSEKPTLKVSDAIVRQIRYLCAMMPDLEWSGILFYKILEGSIEDANNLVMEIVTIWPMAKGTQAAVNFDYDEDWVDVYEDIPELEECSKGVIHSHNKMSTFHSGTDMNDLETNHDQYKFYLSLVTNNNTEFDCKIALACERKTTRTVKSTSWYNFRSYGNKNTAPVIDEKEEEVTEKLMLLYNVQIETETPIVVVDELFAARTKEIFEKKAPVTTYYGKGYHGKQTDMFDNTSQDWRWDRRVDSYSGGLNSPSKHVTPEVEVDDIPDFKQVTEIIRLCLVELYPKTYKVTDVDKEFAEYMLVVRTPRDLESDATNFKNAMLRHINADLLMLEKDVEARPLRKMQLIEDLIDYLDFFEYSEFKSAFLSDLDIYIHENYLQ